MKLQDISAGYNGTDLRWKYFANVRLTAISPNSSPGRMAATQGRTDQALKGADQRCLTMFYQGPPDPLKWFMTMLPQTFRYVNTPDDCSETRD